MKAAPAIESMEVVDTNVLKIKFQGMSERYVDLTKFPLLGVAKKLVNNPEYLKKFTLVDGVPEWEDQCLIGPEDLLKHSSERFHTKIASHYL